MASQLRSDLWVSAFVRRHNDLGRMCVVSRRGDPVAGQVWVEVDHLNGTASLYTPAPAALRPEDTAERYFGRRVDRGDPALIRARIARESEFDPDLWVVSLDLRGDDPGLEVVAGA